MVITPNIYLLTWLFNMHLKKLCILNFNFVIVEDLTCPSTILCQNIMLTYAFLFMGARTFVAQEAVSLFLFFGGFWECEGGKLVYPLHLLIAWEGLCIHECGGMFECVHVHLFINKPWPFKKSISCAFSFPP